MDTSSVVSSVSSAVSSTPSDVTGLLTQGNTIAQQNQTVLVVILIAVALLIGLEIGRAFSFWKW